MRAKSAVIMERVLCFLGAIAITVGVVLHIRGYYISFATDSGHLVYSIVCMGLGVLLYLSWFVLFCWRIHGHKDRGILSEDASLPTKAEALLGLLKDLEVLAFIQKDQHANQHFQDLIDMISNNFQVEYDTKDAFHDQESQQQDSEDPWRTPYYSEYQQKHSPDGAHSSHHYTTTESQYPTSRV